MIAFIDLRSSVTLPSLVNRAATITPPLENRDFVLFVSYLPQRISAFIWST